MIIQILKCAEYPIEKDRKYEVIRASGGCGAFNGLDEFQYLSGAAFTVHFGLQDRSDPILLLLAFILLALLLQHQEGG